MGMSGNYSFLEDWTGGDENVARSYLVGPTYLEDADGKGIYFTNAYVAAHNPTGSKVANRHTISLEGTWLKVRSGIAIQDTAKPEFRLQLSKPSQFPDITDGKALIESKVSGKSTRYQEKIKKLEEEQAVKASLEANIKAEAEAKAKIEAITKAAEAKAKEDARLLAAKMAALKKTTITCVKGKTTKKVTGAKPKCPSGYIKK
jgi:hypothetical protein